MNTLYRRREALTLIPLSIAGLLTGCEKRREQSTSPIAAENSEFVVAIMLDMSGSYAELMADDGVAYRFALRVVDQYFRERLGSNDKIIIGQISGTTNDLLWNGLPQTLRRSFPSSDRFRDFLRMNSNVNGSRVHEGVASAIDYVLAYPGVADGKTKSAIFVLSDMVDNFPDSEGTKQKLLQSVSAYAQKGGIVGLYWVDQSLLFEWRTNLQNAGLRDFVVESQIVAEPTLPNFE